MVLSDWIFDKLIKRIVFDTLFQIHVWINLICYVWRLLLVFQLIQNISCNQDHEILKIFWINNDWYGFIIMITIKWIQVVFEIFSNECFLTFLYWIGLHQLLFNLCFLLFASILLFLIKIILWNSFVRVSDRMLFLLRLFSSDNQYM